MSSDFTVGGVEIGPTDPDGFAELYGTELGLRPRAAVSTSAASRSLGRTVELTGADDDIVEIEDADGIVRFARAAALVEQARTSGIRGTRELDLTTFLDRALPAGFLDGLAGQAGGGARGEGPRSQTVALRRYSVALPPEIATAVAQVDRLVGQELGGFDGSRSPAGLVANLVPGFLFSAPARLAMQTIVDWIDEPADDLAAPEQRRRRPKQPGVYRVGPELLLEPSDRLDAGETPGDPAEPCLVLLHGTFSHTEAAFAGLRGTPEWTALHERYPGRILAVEHPTLGRTPAQNALEAAGLLPAGARLHLLSHSRGGLVGEALSLCAAGRPELRAYRVQADQDGGTVPHPDVEALPRLYDAVHERRLTVERFVRVACPARGTTLASRRLDRWASLLFNAFALVPVLRETGIAALVKKFLVTLLDQRTDPRLVPGLEAQMPESPFLRTLRAAPEIDDGLCSITGDVEPSGVLKRLVVGLGDVFFGQQNDLVVETSSMSGGIPRTRDAAANLKGKDVFHSGYFTGPESRRRLAARIETGTPTEGERAAARQLRDAGGRRRPERVGRVLLVPDLFGSRLTLDGTQVWPEVGEVLRRGAERALSLDGKLGTDGLVGAYAPLLAALGPAEHVTGFAYDPRLPLADAAAGLAEKLHALLRTGRGPVHLVAHGAGALVALAALGPRPAAGRSPADDWATAGSRAVFLSPPLDGAPIAAAHLAGETELCAALGLLDGTSPAAQIGTLLGRWPLLRELDPTDEQAGARRAALQPAGAVAERISTILGSAERTVCRHERWGFALCADGDGLVLHPRDGRVRYFAAVPSAALPADPGVCRAVTELLRGREPGTLSSVPRAAATLAPIPLPDVRGSLLLPTGPDLLRAAWGGSAPASTERTLEIRIVHGDLQRQDGPVMVGHQNATPLAGAEKAADRRLGGILDRRAGLGAYPGPLGTAETFGDPPTVVIGLGEAGDLTPAALTAAVTRGVLRLAVAHRDRHPAITALRLSTALVGTAQVPPISVESSLNSLVTGVRHANRRLRDAREDIVVTGLDVVELFEERAVQAVHALRRLVPATAQGPADPAEDRVIVHDRLVQGRAGRPGAPRLTADETMWQTLRIVRAEPGAGRPQGANPELAELSFTSIGHSARAEQRVNTGQRALLDALVAEAIGNPRVPDQLLNTLYELLVPNPLKAAGYGEEHLMVVVDEQSAALPLEMLATRPAEGGIAPLATTIGLIRRLETGTFDTLARQAAGQAALVIGDPPGTGQLRLPGAREEARRVADALEQRGYQVTSIISSADPGEGPQVVRILNALFERSYRIVHLAGHGAYSTDPSRSGMLIGPDRFLTALEVGKMMTAPSLVFLNCCHLARMRPDGSDPAPAGPPLRADRLAAGISRQLIDNGVRAVVAAGWAVDDQAAGDFADVFYERMLDGEDLGSASLAARKEIYRRHPGVNTWGAYQIYGPPAMRLALDRAAPRRRERVAGPSELRRRLRELIGRAEAPECGDPFDAIRAELDELLADVPPGWLRGRVLALLARLWEALAGYEEAVSALEALRRDWDADPSLDNLERLANLKAKWAVQIATGVVGAPPGCTWETLLQEATDDLGLLLRLGRTPHRYALRGSVHRRWARCVESPQQITEALRVASEAYRDATELHRRERGTVHPYSATNHVVLDWLVAARDAPAETGTAGRLALLEEARETAERSREDFWDRTAGADTALAAALLSGGLGTEVDAIAEAYATAFAGSSRQNRATILEHLDMIKTALPDPDGPAGAALARLRSILSAWRPLQDPPETPSAAPFVP